MSLITPAEDPGADVETRAAIPAELADPFEASERPDRKGAVLRYLQRNPTLPAGLVLILSLLLFSFVGALVWDVDRYRPLSVRALQPPSAEIPFGSDRQGRDLLATMIAGTPLTLRIGLIAGLIGVGVGTI